VLPLLFNWILLTYCCFLMSVYGRKVSLIVVDKLVSYTEVSFSPTDVAPNLMHAM
jgi:hypothetical protein